MGDIKQADQDAKDAKLIAQRMGIPDANIHMLTNKTNKEVLTHLKDIQKRLSKQQ